MKNIKHGEVLGLHLESVTEDGLIVRLPYSDSIVGNPETGVIHGGAITSLMDQSCGLAAAQVLAPEFDITPTIDLRIDYMRPATPNQDVFAYVTAYRKTRHVIFTRGVAYQDSIDQPIAHCVANFMRMGLTNVPWNPAEAAGYEKP